MKYEHKIYVSYARADEDWVKNFIKGLTVYLRKEFGEINGDFIWARYMGWRESAGDRDKVKEHLSGSETFLLVLSKAYIHSESCREKEFDVFLDEKGAERIFIIEHEEIKREKIKNEVASIFFDKIKKIQRVTNYKFWFTDQEGRNHQLYVPHVPNFPEVEYYQRLKEVACNLSNELKESVEDNSQISIYPKITIYLAKSPERLENRHIELRNILEKQGFYILPDKNKVQSQLKSDLKEASFFVQLIDIKSNEQADQQYAQAKKIGIHTFQWCDTTIFKHIKGDERKKILNSDDILIMRFENFKKHLLLQIKEKSQKKIEESVSVFINAPKVTELMNEIQKKLSDNNITFSSSDVENSLRSCDAIIMICNGAPLTWIEEHVRNYKRVLASRTKPFKEIAIFNESPINIEIQGVPILQCLTSVNDGCFQPFLEILKL